MPTRAVQRRALAEDMGSLLGRRDLKEALTCWNVANELTQEFTHASLLPTDTPEPASMVRLTMNHF